MGSDRGTFPTEDGLQRETTSIQILAEPLSGCVTPASHSTSLSFYFLVREKDVKMPAGGLAGRFGNTVPEVLTVERDIPPLPWSPGSYIHVGTLPAFHSPSSATDQQC